MGWARLASVQATQGQFASAEVAAANAADLGDGSGWADLAGEFEFAGFPEDAEHAARKAAPCEWGGLFGEQDGWRQIIRLRRERQDWVAVERACEEYREIDEDYAQKVLATIHERLDNYTSRKQ
ncbi:hypothetical protein [Nocardia brasiliensis]|uniref:hypothetical protein n=1 Tax=Nocardia brasiliensis TaxID=37326 RepID=UPI0033D4A023